MARSSFYAGGKISRSSSKQVTALKGAFNKAYTGSTEQITEADASTGQIRYLFQNTQPGARQSMVDMQERLVRHWTCGRGLSSYA